MERTDRSTVAAFYAPGAWGATVELGERAAHHARVKRLVVGDAIRLTSGDGRRALGEVAELGSRRLMVTVDAASLEMIREPLRVDIWAPVGDRDRMLLLAEKAVELGASTWQPIVYHRSRSVMPRGEGAPFGEKVRARQIGALEQCGSAWLPVSRAEMSLEDALAADTERGGARFLLDADGESLGALLSALETPVRLALGPEGGLEEFERAQFIQAGWRPVSLGANILRFETAGIAAVAVVRSHLYTVSRLSSLL